MVLDVVLLQLSTSAAKAVARMWIKSETGTDIAEGLIGQLSTRLPGLVERRRTARQFQDMADRISMQLAPMVQAEYGELPPNELEAAILAVARLVESAQDLEASALFAIDMDPVALEELLRNQPRAAVRDDLIPAGQVVFDRLLRENCTFIIELTMSMPQFASAALVELMKRENEIIGRVQRALERIPQPAALRADADQEFGVRYRRHISRELDRLELFGLTLSDSSSRYDLSIAYITLSATTPAPKAVINSDHAGTGPSGSEEGSPRTANIDSDDDADTDDLRVDEALAAGSLHLVRGEAGSGKTTLLQWLAVTASRRGFIGSLESWSDCTPFFLQLRRYANKPLPRPEDFLEHAAATIAGVMPTGWIHRQLESGQALLLIDGVDELPEHQRKEAREWLLALLREFPDCRYIVTTRPPAVPETWLDQAGFLISELLPMSLPDILKFVQHWYDAARGAVAHSAAEISTLDRYQGELVRVIGENPAIRSLATAPLLCAMLCALNRDRRTQLPRDRMELYRIALESLLDRRDVEREISQHDAVALGLREKETLLQDLAHWLILNEKTDITREAAVARIRTRLAYMTSISGSPEQVFNHLLTRSGLIREPVEGRIDFIHRTFQEYLGAARAISEGNVPMLISKAHDDQWREVIILSAGHATVLQRDELITGLLERGEREQGQRHKLHLLAVACLETAVELSPATASAVNQALAAALPPLNMTDARAVASAGPLAANLLSHYSKGSRATVAAACVRALCLIGGENAFNSIRKFRSDRRLTVIKELLRGWDYFDREAYAKDVLAFLTLSPEGLELTEVAALSQVHHLPKLEHLSFRVPPSCPPVVELPNADRITSLEVSRAGYDLSGIQGLSSLRTLKLGALHGLTQLPGLPDSLGSLTIEFCRDLKDLSAIAALPRLFELELSMVPVANLNVLRNLPLQSLQVRGIYADDLSWLSTLDHLVRLRLWGRARGSDAVALGPDGTLRYLSGAVGLRDLIVSPGSSLRSFHGAPPSLVQLRVPDAVDLEDASALMRCSKMQSLLVNNAPNLTDFEFLKGLTSLVVLDLDGCEAYSDTQLLTSRSLQYLSLVGTSVADISPLSQCRSLHSVNLTGCPIETLEPLNEFAPPLSITIDASKMHLVTDELKQKFRIMGRRMVTPPPPPPILSVAESGARSSDG